MSVETQSDEHIAALVQAGDKEAFGLVVDRYEAKLLRYGRKFLARHEDIEDIVQDVFISAYQNIQSFDTAQRLSPWLYRIAHNAFINALRKGSRAPLIIDFDTLISHPVYDDPSERLRDQKDMRAQLDRGLETLSPKYREVLALYYFEEMSYKDIAEVLQVPQGTVGIRLRRAKEALKATLEQSNGQS
jgi:RNA polymerase sigma-70 factor (ECF subfamily)